MIHAWIIVWYPLLSKFLVLQRRMSRIRRLVLEAHSAAAVHSRTETGLTRFWLLIWWRGWSWWLLTWCSPVLKGTQRLWWTIESQQTQTLLKKGLSKNTGCLPSAGNHALVAKRGKTCTRDQARENMYLIQARESMHVQANILNLFIRSSACMLRLTNNRPKILLINISVTFPCRTKASFENWLKNTRFSVELVVPRTVCVMLNVVIQAKKQVRDRKISQLGPAPSWICCTG